MENGGINEYEITLAEEESDIGDGDPEEVDSITISVTWDSGSDGGGTMTIKEVIDGIVD